ncbi:MAG: 4-hydroxy-3-methylbut-2-enyl diphosphate reductase [Defluviitaleaceae bacterium]|nr:4-hydroxy-3-methylbut-2-enyl diphosphate reductase [Defluviitaleaceae bacterium]
MIKTAKESGFCHGVRAAVYKADAQRGEGVYLFGDLVNNQHVMNGYRRRGFNIVQDADDVEPGGTVIIRAHGVPRAVYDALARKTAEIVDCTCPKVKSIHEIVSEKSTAGHHVIIIGKNGHPEVVGIFGWCEAGTATVAEKESDLAGVLRDSAPLCVVAQTTCKKAWWERAVALIKSKRPDAEIFDTLCGVTAARISRAVEMAKESDVMVVVGDKKSANSLELYEACRAENANVLFVESLEELLNVKEFPDTGAAIGLAGSASAPADIIDEIHGFLLFSNFLAQAKSEIEEASDKYLQEIIKSAKGKPFVEEALISLYEQNQNGKRIRGALIKLGAAVSTAANTADMHDNPHTRHEAGYLPVAVAYEIFQTAILIHDDIIDKSPKRRGRATIHSAEADAHFGNSRAICIGDYGLFLANKILAESGLPPETLVKVLRLFSQIQLTTLEGEIMDVSLPYYPIDIAADYEKFTYTVNCIFEYKTAWYTLAGPIMLGAVCGGGDEKLITLLRDITMPLGIAFQIKDDLLGIYAGEEVLGKPALSDIFEKKQTLLYGYAYKHATPQQRERLNKSYGNPRATSEDLETVREIFTATGAKAHAEEEIRRLSQASLDLVNTMEKKHQTILHGLVHYLITRKF